MKKLFTTALLAMAMLVAPFVGSAQAGIILEDWTLDLTGYGGAVHTGVDQLNVHGQSVVTQYFDDSDGILLNDGDTFAEMSYLTMVGVETDFGVVAYPPLVSVAAGDELFFYADSLTGYITDVSYTNPLDLSTYSFTYIFDPGSIVTMYAGDHNNVAGSTAIMSFDLFQGEGQNIGTDLGGALLSGDADILVNIPAADPGEGVFLYDFGEGEEDIQEWLAAHLSQMVWLDFNLINNLLVTDLAFGVDGELGEFFTAPIETSGDVVLVLTPEPATLLIFGAGLSGLAVFRRRRQG